MCPTSKCHSLLSNTTTCLKSKDFHWNFLSRNDQNLFVILAQYLIMMIHERVVLALHFSNLLRTALPWIQMILTSLWESSIISELISIQGFVICIKSFQRSMVLYFFILWGWTSCSAFCLDVAFPSLELGSCRRSAIYLPCLCYLCLNTNVHCYEPVLLILYSHYMILFSIDYVCWVEYGAWN